MNSGYRGKPDLGWYTCGEIALVPKEKPKMFILIVLRERGMTRPRQYIQ